MVVKLAKRVFLSAVFVVAAASIAGAQEVASSFEQLRVLVKAGDTITVTDASGRDVTGTISHVSASTLGLVVAGTPRDLGETDVAVISERIHGSLATGAKWGLGIGVAFGLVGGLAQGSDCIACGTGSTILATGAYGGLGAGIGVGIAAMTSHRHVIYDRRGRASLRFSVLPLMTRERRGVLISMGF